MWALHLGSLMWNRSPVAQVPAHMGVEELVCAIAHGEVAQALAAPQITASRRVGLVGIATVNKALRTPVGLGGEVQSKEAVAAA